MDTHSAGYGGKLDGLTILRFAHAYESGGGLEQHLADLNRELGRRNRITTVQMQLTSDLHRVAETEQRIGRSLLLTVPLPVRGGLMSGQGDGDALAPAWLNRFKYSGLNLILRTPQLNNVAARQFSKWRGVPRRAGEPDDAGARAAAIMRRFPVSLIVLHANGGADASEIIQAARSAGIPVALVHHFANDRLGGVSLRQQIASVDGVAGASSVGIPRYLESCFWNLSDAVDTTFYSRESARSPHKELSGPVLYAPGRLTPDKGQAAVIEVAAILRRRGLDATVVFAGRVDSPDFVAHLQRMAEQRGLAGSVRFLGPLSLEAYRDWYGAADVMLMPTRHKEGMPRTLIESQAMKVPPVVYDIGGTSEGLRDKQTGFLLRVGDVDGMARAVETLVRNPELHRSMAETGRQFVEEAFSLTAFARRHEDFYLQVLARARRRPVIEAG
jgi:glycosyltransferase involved in cell wall biosynthesis